MKHVHSLLAVACAALALAGCATSTKTEAPAAAAPSAPATTAGADAPKGAVAATAESEPAEHLVYFAFDSSTIDGAGSKLLEAHARYIGTHPNVKVRLEGHADERGTRTYNLSLGERRAQAVGRALRAMGTRNNNVETVSYGEEKPQSPAHDEKGWAKNRRVEIVYR